jgi:nucleotide-binding universal stress UspA family protein
MYRQMMVPVDLEHVGALEKALTTAADLARHYGTPVCYVGVTATTPGPVAHTPEEFEKKLQGFAKEQADRHGLETGSRVYVSHDPARDLDGTLIKAIEEIGADVVVMASHQPGFPEHIFASNAGYVASHAEVSVFVIR